MYLFTCVFVYLYICVFAGAVQQHTLMKLQPLSRRRLQLQIPGSLSPTCKTKPLFYVDLLCFHPNSRQPQADGAPELFTQYDKIHTPKTHPKEAKILERCWFALVGCSLSRRGLALSYPGASLSQSQLLKATQGSGKPQVVDQSFGQVIFM